MSPYLRSRSLLADPTVLRPGNLFLGYERAHGLTGSQSMVAAKPTARPCVPVVVADGIATRFPERLAVPMTAPA